MASSVNFECETPFRGKWNPVLPIEQRDLADLVALVFHSARTGEDPKPALDEALAPYGISARVVDGGVNA